MKGGNDVREFSFKPTLYERPKTAKEKEREREKAEDEAGYRRRLVHVSHETLEHKDFRAEVRGLRDISTLLEKCSVMLDVTVSDFSFILEDELIRVFSGSK